MIRRDPHRQKHVGGFHRPRTARGTGRDSDPLEVEGDNQRLRFDPGKRQITGMRQPSPAMAVPKPRAAGRH